MGAGVVCVTVASCAPRAATDTSGTSSTTTSNVVVATSEAVAQTSASTAAHDLLASLQIDDRPNPDRPYRRDEWPTWEDIDGDGCDAREQALIEQSTSRAQVDPSGCKVVAGDWTSVYDGITTTDPAALDIDHVVPLENAHISGGWQWDASRRRQFANDQLDLLAVTAASNRSKGSSTPAEWRPRREAWCALATTWVMVKTTYGLTATTAERDALGQMLDTCGAN